MTSKIVVKNIFYMLSYAFKVLMETNYSSIAVEDFDNINNLYAAILSKGVSQQIKQGLHREYVSNEEPIPGIKGKILIENTINLRINRMRMNYCQYDVYSVNNLYNQIVKCGMKILINAFDVEDKYKNELRKLLLYFSDVDYLDYRSIDWNHITYSRYNESYKMLINICYFIIESVLPSDDGGRYRFADFIDSQKMSRLYEKFVLEYYKRHYPALNPRVDSKKIHTDEKYSTGNIIDFLPNQITDVILSKGNKILIIDAKYYTKVFQQNTDKKSLRSSHINQVYMYCQNHSIEDDNLDVSGMLLYAKNTSESIPEGSEMIINKILSVNVLNLEKDFSEIKQKLDLIVHSNFPSVIKVN